MAAHLRGGSGALTTTITTLIASTSGIDRYVLVHVSAATSAAINVFLDANSSTLRVLAPYVNVAANDTRDFGPYFISSTETLRGWVDVANGWVTLDEQRP